MIRFDQQICTNFEKASQKEWLETNGLGGFASSTITGMNTRRYHGLLTAATKPPVGRIACLAKLEETVVIDGRRYELSVNQYPGAIHPRGDQYLKEFRLDPFPVFIYELNGMQIIKSVFMIAGENTTVIQYELRESVNATQCQLTPSDCRLEIRPLLAFRDYHATMRETNSINANFAAQENLVSIMPFAGMPTLYLAHDAQSIQASGYWYRNFEYSEERQRGLDFTEDLFQPFVLQFDLSKDANANMIASTAAHDIKQVGELRQTEITRRQRLAAMSPVDDELIRRLTVAADQFIVARGEQKTVIAGYHWFSDWGRDTMIALPGLMYATCPTEVGRSILLEFAKHTSQGMLPNRFPDAGEEPEYNTIDATLWFFEAIRSLAERTEDFEFVRTHLYDTLIDIIDWHLKGTRYGIKVDEDGLLRGGEAGVQLTWMDAKVGGFVVTPRIGKPVEIQALWYNALRIMENFARRFNDEVREKLYRVIADRARQSFNEKFWDEETGYLYDVIGDDFKDASLRPNQILAVSLPHTMLASDRALRVVEVIERELLTPFGLRSLNQNNMQYRPIYTGDSYGRDTAYHQGTVWAWLMGAFITAYVKVHERSAASVNAAKRLLAGFREHLNEAGLGQVSEIFDADAPHRPRGCIAQAWSVAELLRAACEDVYQISSVDNQVKSAKK
ncbi:MAG: amylo-alpha-1,6-glucosidase [Acidobacteriota bacterium]